MTNDIKTIYKLANPYQKMGKFALIIYSLSQLYGYLIVAGVVNYIPLSYIYIMLTIGLGIAFLISFRERQTVVRLTMWLLILWICILHVIWFFPIRSLGGSEIYFQTAAQTLVLSILMLMIGESLGINIEKYGIYSIHRLILCVYIVFATIILYGIYLGLTRYGTLMFYFRNYETDYNINYLLIGDFLAIIGLLVMESTKKLYKQIIYFAVSNVLLFFAYSRTSFYLFLCCGLFLIWLDLNIKKKIIFSLIVVLILATILIPMTSINVNNDPLALQRMTILILNPLVDQSLQGRITLLEQGWETLSKNWLFGTYISEWWQTGTTGGYIHNWLSFLESYGVGPFLLFILIDLILVYRSYKTYQVNGTKIQFLVLMFCNAAIMIARSYIWPFIWFAFGLSDVLGKKS